MASSCDRKTLLIALVLTQFAISSDNSIVSLCAHYVVGNFGGTLVDIQLINMMFGLVAGLFMIAGSLVGLFYGWKRILQGGMMLAAAAQIIMAAAPSLPLFIWLGRPLMGIAAALMVPAMLGIIPTMYTGKKRAFAFACTTAGVGASALIPIPVGALVDAFGYRSAFIAMAALFVFLIGLSQSIPLIGAASSNRSFDWQGFFPYTSGILLLFLGITCTTTCGFFFADPNAPFSIGPLSPAIPMTVGGILLLVWFWHIEKRRESHNRSVLLPPAFLDTAKTRNSLLAVSFGFLVSGSFTIAIIPYLQIAAGASGLAVGIMFACAGLPMVAFSVLASRLLPQRSPKFFIRTGYILVSVGLSIVCFAFGQTDPLLFSGVGLFVTGAGIGVANSQANNAMATAVGENNAPQSGGIQGTARDLAFSFSAVASGLILAVLLSSCFALNLAAAPHVSENTVSALTAAQVTFGTDSSLLDNESSALIPPSELEATLDAYRSSRTQANQILLAFLAASSLALLLFTRHIPPANALPESTGGASPRP